MENIQVCQVGKGYAAAVIRAAGASDPANYHTPESVAAAGQCFQLETEGGQGVFVAEKRGAQLWIHGAGALASKGMAADGLPVVEALAAASGCDRVGFQTSRPGLVKVAKKQGYRITGFILEKCKQ